MVPGNLALFFFLVVASLCGGFVRLLCAYQSLLQVSGVTTYHPVIQPLVLCVGASLCLAAYILKSDNPKLMSKSKKFKATYILIPSALTLLRIVSMIIGLRYVSSGVFTSMKSASIIAHVIMEKIFYPMRTYTLNQWTGIITTALGQGFLAADAFFYPIFNHSEQGSDSMEIFYSYKGVQQINEKRVISSESAEDEGNLNSTSLNIVLAITLLLISCFPMPFYYILQERFMKAFKLNELQFLGTQSLICVFVCAILLLVFQWTPCSSNLCIFQDDDDNPSFYFERTQIWWDQLLSNAMFLYTTLSLLIFFPLMTYMDFVIMRKYSGIACNVLSGMYSILPYLYGLAVAPWFRLTAFTIVGFILTIIGVLVFYHIPNFSQGSQNMQQQLGQQQSEQILIDQQGNDDINEVFLQKSEDKGVDYRMNLQEINIDTEILKKRKKGKRKKHRYSGEKTIKIKQIIKDGEEYIDNSGQDIQQRKKCEDKEGFNMNKCGRDKHFLDLSEESYKFNKKRILRLEKVTNHKEEEEDGDIERSQQDRKQQQMSAENDGIEKSIQFSKEELDDEEDEDNKNYDNHHNWQEQQEQGSGRSKQRKQERNDYYNHLHRHHNHFQPISSTSNNNQPQKFHRPHRTSNIARQHSGSAFLSSSNLSHFFPDKKEEENLTDPKNSISSSAQISPNKKQLLQNQYQ